MPPVRACACAHWFFGAWLWMCVSVEVRVRARARECVVSWVSGLLVGCKEGGVPACGVLDDCLLRARALFSHFSQGEPPRYQGSVTRRPRHQQPAAKRKKKPPASKKPDGFRQWRPHSSPAAGCSATSAAVGERKARRPMPRRCRATGLNGPASPRKAGPGQVRQGRRGANSCER